MDPPWVPRRNSTWPSWMWTTTRRGWSRSTQACSSAIPLKHPEVSFSRPLMMISSHFGVDTLHFPLAVKAYKKTGKFPKSMVSCQKNIEKNTAGWWNEFLFALVCMQHSAQSFLPRSRKEVHAVETCTGKLSRGLKAPRGLEERKMVNTQHLS